MIGRHVPAKIIWPIAAIVMLPLASWLLAAHADSYLAYLYGIGLVYATATAGLHLLANDCGDISLAQGGQVALGAFVGAHLFTKTQGFLSPVLLIGGAILAGAVTGAIVSVPMLRLRGLAIAVVTLLLNGAIFHFVLRFSDFVGGSGGLYLRFDDWLPQTDAEAIGWLTAMTVATVIVLRLLRRSRFGLGLRAIRANENLARSTGIPVGWYRTAAYTVAGGTAGVAGAMWVLLNHGIAPSAFTDSSSLLLLTLALLGGRGSLAGPMSAAVAMALLTGLLGEYGVAVSFLAPVVLVFVLITHPGGLNEQLGMAMTGLRVIARRLGGRRAVTPAATPALCAVGKAEGEKVSVDRPVDAEPVEQTRTEPAVLRCFGVDVSFDGLVAVSSASVEVHAGEVVAIMGPNGAGKTTLINALSGHLQPTSGTVWLAGTDVTRVPAHRRAARGLRRTFQVDGHMPKEPGFEHFRLGTHVRRANSSQHTIIQTATSLGLTRADLDTPMADLAAGTARLIEIGTALAVKGQVLLLDEPTVGLTRDERRRIAGILRNLAGDNLAIVLVDHDTAFVRQVAHRVIALDAGRIIAQGPPQDVFTDPAFVTAYLGTSEAPDEPARSG